MNNFIIEGDAGINTPKDSDGHPFRLLKNGEKIFGGTWSDCVEKGFEVGMDDDIITIGTASSATNRKVKELRDEHNYLKELILGNKSQV